MKLFNGLAKTDYQDILRAVGLFLDERAYRSLRLIEHEDGLMLQVLPTVDGRLVWEYETFLLTDDDLEELLRQSYQRRGPRSQPADHDGTAPMTAPTDDSPTASIPVPVHDNHPVPAGAGHKADR